MQKAATTALSIALQCYLLVVFGMPDNAIHTHAHVLASMKYYLKTQYGISTTYIQSSIDAFLFGTGQGSGASPAIWLVISTILLAALSKIACRGMVFKTPDCKLTVERFSDAFLDDAQNGTNDAFLAQSWSLQELSDNLQHTSQSWERLLYCSGGLLELSKCFYYLIILEMARRSPNPINKRRNHRPNTTSFTYIRLISLCCSNRTPQHHSGS